MSAISDLVLSRPDGTPKPMRDFAGRPLIVQTLRYYG